MSIKNSVATKKATVSDGIAALSALASTGLSVHPERCVRLRNRHASCNRCAEACTSGAIACKDGAWTLDVNLCVECGTCATVCPTCALEAARPHDAELLRGARASAREMDGLAVFACAHALDKAQREQPEVGIFPGRVVRVACLSRIDETLLFSLFSQGITRVRAVFGACETCPRKQGVQSARLVERTVSSLAHAWGVQVDYERVSAFPEEVLSRGAEDSQLQGGCQAAAVYPREALPQEKGASALPAKAPSCDLPRQEATLAEGEGHLASPGSSAPMPLAEGEKVALSREGRVCAEYKPTHVQKDGTLPHFVPQRRRKLLDALSLCGEPAAEVIDTRLWGHVIIDFARCKSCKMCAVFCPTGALSRYSDEHGIAGIEHYVAECVHCCLCQDICPAGAITCVTQVPARQLASGETERYAMRDPEWFSGPDQILQRMKVKIGGNSVEHSY